MTWRDVREYLSIAVVVDALAALVLLALCH